MLSASKSGSGLATGYNLTRSLRFRRSATAYLNRTPSVAGNRQKFTISVWYKAGGISASEVNANILNAGGDGSSVLISGTGAFGGTYQDRLLYREGGTTLLYWPMVFRDPASWYHIVFAMDTTQATAANRTKLYVNGVDQGAFSGTAITQNASTSINNTSAHYINTYNGTFYPSDLYYTEYNFIDGQALTPSSFGSTNALTGVWQPAAYTGSYGTNGFYLPFTDNSALTTSSNVGLGKDFSGNANYWVTNNISITTGVTYDSMTDVPTLTSATAANFAVLNPLGNAISTAVSSQISNANLKYSGSSAGGCAATMALPAGKYYFETTISAIYGLFVGLGTDARNLQSDYGLVITNIYGWYINPTISLVNNGTSTTWTGNTVSTGTVVNLAIDASNLSSVKVWLGKANVYYDSSAGTTGNPSTGANPTLTITAGINLYPNLGFFGGGTSTIEANFGQRPFTYTAPTGFVALNTYNLPTSTIVKGNTVMDATLYTGTGATLNVVNAAPFKPDLVWLKARSATYFNALFDSVRGANKVLVSNSTDQERTETAGSLSSFNSSGFTLASGTATYAAVNNSGTTYVGWQWQAGQGSTSSNTNGTITSTVSVNASAGFSVVTYTGTGANATVGHGLGVAPQFIIAKNRPSSADAWCLYHVGLTSAAFFIKLNSTDAQASGVGVWNSTAPTSSVFSVGSSSGSNGSTNAMVAYCWTPIAGFSAFGSYAGNSSTDGPFVYTGFRPRWVLIKSSTQVTQWILHDTARDTSNATSATLFPNLSNAETANNSFDILSNGFKIRVGSGESTNDSGQTYIYMAFAENPLKYALAR